MTTDEKIKLLQLAVQSLTTVSIPFIVAKLAKATPDPNSQQAVTTQPMKAPRPLPPVWPLVLFVALSASILFCVGLRNAPLDAASVGTICLSVGGIVIGSLLILISRYHYSLSDQIQQASIYTMELMHRSPYPPAIAEVAKTDVIKAPDDSKCA